MTKTHTDEATRTDIQWIKAELIGLKEQLKDDYNGIRSEIKSLKRYFKDSYVTRDEFDPVRNLVYGAVAIILTTVIAALLYLVVN